jgi:glycogen synthase
VVDATDRNLASARTTGFRFDQLFQLIAAVARVSAMFQKMPERWQALMRQGMAQDLTGHKSAERYLEVYQEVLQRDAADRSTGDYPPSALTVSRSAAMT